MIELVFACVLCILKQQPKRISDDEEFWRISFCICLFVCLFTSNCHRHISSKCLTLKSHVVNHRIFFAKNDLEQKHCTSLFYTIYTRLNLFMPEYILSSSLTFAIPFHITIHTFTSYFFSHKFFIFMCHFIHCNYVFTCIII